MKTDQIRGWILLDDDLDYLRKMICLAPAHGINQIQLSHKMCMFAEEILNDSKRAADINGLIELGNSRGLRVFVWSHEIAGLPESFKTGDRIDLDNPGLYQWIEDKYDRLFAALPGLAGIVMTYSETDVKVFDDRLVRSAMSRADRITRLTESIWASCRRHGRELIARDWADAGTGSWEELLDFEEGLRRSDPAIVIMTKHTAGDWYLLAGNPLMGTVGDHIQICEFDLCGEHHGNQTAPWCCPEYVQDRWLWALSKGAKGAAGRVDRGDRHALGTLGEVNLFAFSRLLDDAGASIETIWSEWAAKEFGGGAAERVIAALKRTDAVILKTFYARRAYWGSDHSRVPAFDYLHDHLKGRTGVPFDPSFEPIERDLLNPTEETLAWVLAEKDEALGLVEESLRDIDAARVVLSERDYVCLRDFLERSAALVSLFRQINEAYFHVVFVEQSEGERRRHWADQFARSSVLLMAAGDRIFRRWGTDFVLADSREERSYISHMLPRLIDEMQKRVEMAMSPQ